MYPEQKSEACLKLRFKESGRALTALLTVLSVADMLSGRDKAGCRLASALTVANIDTAQQKDEKSRDDRIAFCGDILRENEKLACSRTDRRRTEVTVDTLFCFGRDTIYNRELDRQGTM